MKKIAIIFIFLFSFVNAQTEQQDLVKKPVYAFKFGPRLLKPRFGFEKFIDSHSSFGFELRYHAYAVAQYAGFFYLPQALRIEGSYRKYFKDTAPYGAYFNVKAAFGYFNYAIINPNSIHGIMVGAGSSFGGQFRMGKKGLVDIFGGIQLISPIYFRMTNGAYNYSHGDLYLSNLTHYVFIASPIELGIRFGFIQSKSVPKD
jgi:hypothetical protein